MNLKIRFFFLELFLFVFTACTPNEKGQETTKSSQNAANRYNPRVSPLPGRTPRPLEEWGIDNGETIISHTFSAFSDPMYPSDFTHFDYVNPDALQGGILRLAIYGIFDDLNVYSSKLFDNVNPIGYIYDTLMVQSMDEIDALYPLIAQKIEYAKDFSYAIFHIDPRARFPEGQPITAEDVIFSFIKFMEQGQIAQYFGDAVKVRALNSRKVRFDLARPSRSMIRELTSLVILPQQFWKDRDLREPITEISPDDYMGSGGWKIADYETGSWILFEKRNDYWGADLPVNKGMHNFQYYRIDYYQNIDIAFKAFLAGEYNIYVEQIAKNWATKYNGPLLENGIIIKAPFPDTQAPSIQGMIFNTQKALFRDYRIRRAISYALDFEQMNQDLFYGFYERTRSYFQNTIYEAKELPSKEELAILEPIREQIPPEVFTKIYEPLKTYGSTRKRAVLRQKAALELLKEAGWKLKGGILQNRETGEPFVFEIMVYGPYEERISLPLQQNLKKMGITMNIKMGDVEQYEERLLDGQYDMINYGYAPNHYPTTDMKLSWHSDSVESLYNLAKVSDPAIDYLIEGIIANQGNKNALVHWGRAFDRVFQHQSYMILQWHNREFWIAHTDKFGKPEVWPKYGQVNYIRGNAWEYWWLDPKKLVNLPRNFR